MSASILSLHAVNFDTRISLEDCMVNFEGNTLDCIIEKVGGTFTWPTYAVFEKLDNNLKGAELFTFTPYHLSSLSSHPRSQMYSISGVNGIGASATLIIPYPKWLYEREGDPYQDVCTDYELYCEGSSA